MVETSSALPGAAIALFKLLNWLFTMELWTPRSSPSGSDGSASRPWLPTFVYPSCDGANAEVSSGLLSTARTDNALMGRVSKEWGS